MSISLETCSLPDSSTMIANLIGSIKIHESADRVRYVLPPRPRNQCVRRLFWRSGILIFQPVAYGLLVVWAFFTVGPSTEAALGTVLGVGLALIGMTNLMVINVGLLSGPVWVSLMEFLGERTEIELTPTTLCGIQRRGLFRETAVFSRSQIDRLEVQTRADFLGKKETHLSCEIRSRSYSLISQDHSPTVVLELAHDLGRRINRIVALLETVYDD